MGIVGLETAFPVLYTKLVLTGRIPLERILEAMTTEPRRIFRIGGALEPGAPADIAVIDTDEPFVIDPTCFASKGKATPFEGWEVRGRIVLNLKNGKLVYNQLNKK
jgi:dihydroorotase